MPESVISVPTVSTARPSRAGAIRRLPRPSRGALPWLAVALLVVILALLFVLITGMRPAYDAYGWLVWGHQAIHLSLNTNSAPSWKPLPFLFTLPYALLGRGALWLWMVTAASAAFAAPVFAGRSAYRLSGAAPEHRWAAVVGAVFAGAGVLGIEGYWHFILIATADPMMVALCLAAVDCHIHGRRTAAWVLIVLTALGRPEIWPIGALYALWLWRTEPHMRRDLLIGLAVIPTLWFGFSRLTSPSWNIAGTIDRLSTVPLPGNRVTATLNGFTSLYEFPMQLAAAISLALAALRRDWRLLLIALAGVAWLAVEVALALHGEAPVPRYMFEPAAVMVLIVGATVGWLLGSPFWRWMRWAGLAGAIALAVTLAPGARYRARLVHNGIGLGQTWARVIRRLHTVIEQDGGVRAVLACGQAVTTVPFQSITAWELGVNVRQVAWVPAEAIATGQPIVYFKPYFAGWQVMAIHSRDPACARLDRNTPSN